MPEKDAYPYLALSFAVGDHNSIRHRNFYLLIRIRITGESLARGLPRLLPNSPLVESRA